MNVWDKLKEAMEDVGPMSPPFEANIRQRQHELAAIRQHQHELAAKHGSLGLGDAGHAHGQAAARQRTPSNADMLCMRMRWNSIHYSASGFAHIDIHGHNDKMFVWIITKAGDSVVLEDESALFPSDTLITKLKMME
jgi:hypothetical protein